MSLWAVVPAGGSGTRYAANEDKLMAQLAGKPVLAHTLGALLEAPGMSGIVLAASPQNRPTYEALIQQAFPNAPIQVILGGASRRASVYAGLKALPTECSTVAIHDAARPLIRPTLIAQAVEALQKGFVGAIIALPLHDTVKQAHPSEPQCPSIAKTLDRSLLWRAQTPQVFRKDLIINAHESIDASLEATDDAQLMELAGLGPVALIPGEERNLKITSRGDLALAEALLGMQ